jgi:DNA-binding CsgD family transcriptional regulator
MLLGRAREQARIGALLDAARSGRGGALVIIGEAGIGKSALLDDVASVEEFTVLRVRGIETESEIGFSGLRDLLTPILPGLSDLPRRQAAAIESALSIGPMPPTERLAISAGALNLIAVASQTRPIVAIVDDAHLLDRASADTLAFVARRLADDPVAMVLAVRQGEASSFSSEGLDELAIEPLDGASATALVDRRLDPLSADAKARVLALAGGNPLAVLELPAPTEQDAGMPAASVALSPGSLLAKAFGRRIERLPDETRTALAVAAATDADDLLPVLAACHLLGISAEAFAPAEAAAIFAIEGNTFHFRHPLVRAAAYAVASPPVRRQAHRALAAALIDDWRTTRWAWHRALAAVGPDDDAAAALEASAARSTNAHARARALERAARLSEAGPPRTRRLLAAALAAEDAGNLGAAEQQAKEARLAASDARQISEIDHLLGRIWTRNGDPERAAEVLAAGAAIVAPVDPDRAALMLADAVEATIHDLDRAEGIAAEALGLLRPGSRAEQLVQLRIGDVYGWRGRAEEASACWRRSAELADPNDPDSLRLAAEALFSAGDDDEAVVAGRTAIDLARAQSQDNALTQSLEFLAEAEGRRGRLLEGLAAITEKIDLVVALGQAREERYGCVEAAWIEAALGREQECRGHATRAIELDERMGMPQPRNEALGVLELALGRPEVAIAVLERVPLDPAVLRADAIAPRSFVPAYVEALVQVGRTSEARPISEAYAETADRSKRPLAIGLARRCQGLAEGSVEVLESSVAILGAAGNRYERARTQLCLGQLLRRRGKRADASDALKPAFEAFTAIGADGWAERARAELRVTGVAVRRPMAAHDELTPQERTVAGLVSSGLTNREIAERLFVTTNTVETHVRHIFQKLDVSSRTQLAITFRE